jgi:single-strand DNA-binding protein
MSIPASILGRMAADPVLQFSANGKPIARFTIVTSGRKLNKSNDTWEDVDVSWWKCTAFDQLAENICEHLGKGAAVIAQGTVSQDDWTDKDGNNRTSLKAVINNLGPDFRWQKRKDAAGTSQAAGYGDERPPF